MKSSLSLIHKLPSPRAQGHLVGHAPQDAEHPRNPRHQNTPVKTAPSLSPPGIPPTPHQSSPPQPTKSPYPPPRRRSLLIGSHNGQFNGNHIKNARTFIAHSRRRQHLSQPRQQSQLCRSVLDGEVPGNRAPPPYSIRSTPIAAGEAGTRQAIIRRR